MKRNIILILFLLRAFSGFSDTLSFDSIYQVTYSELFYTKPKEALVNLYYLYDISVDDAEKIKVLLLKSELLWMSGIKDEALNSLLEADSLVSYTNNYMQGAMINGILSKNYRVSGYRSLSNKHLDKAIGYINQIEDSVLQYRMKANVNQEKAFADISLGNFTEAVEALRLGRSYIDSAVMFSGNISGHINYAVNYQLLARAFGEEGLIDSSLYYNQRALNHLDSSDFKGAALRGFIYLGFANSYVSYEEYEKAEEYYQKALEVADITNNFSLRIDSYKLLLNFYKEVDDIEKYIELNEKYIQLKEKEASRQEGLAANLLTVLSKKIEESEKKNESKKDSNLIRIILIVAILAVLPLTVIFFLSRKKVEKEAVVNGTPTKNQKKNNSSSDKPYMSKETEDAIYKDLLEMETTEYYLDPNVSLSYLSSKMDINQRYLSYVIKSKQNKDFTTYINELRIDYIVKFLLQDDKHLNYKISYLAETAGFSSHSRFTVNFKKVTGVNPSEYIDNIKASKNVTD